MPAVMCGARAGLLAVTERRSQRRQTDALLASGNFRLAKRRTALPQTCCESGVLIVLDMLGSRWVAITDSRCSALIGSRW